MHLLKISTNTGVMMTVVRLMNFRGIPSGPACLEGFMLFTVYELEHQLQLLV